MHINITVDPRSERELEVFAQLGKGGDIANSDLEAICRMVSLWLRAGGSLQHVVQQLRGIGSSLQVRTKEGKIMSLADGLARALMKYVRVKTKYGLKSLILGEFDINCIDDAAPAPGNGHSASRPANGNGSNGNGNGNGNGTKPRNGNGQYQPPGAGFQRLPRPVGCPEHAVAEGSVQGSLPRMPKRTPFRRRLRNLR